MAITVEDAEGTERVIFPSLLVTERTPTVELRHLVLPEEVQQAKCRVISARNGIAEVLQVSLRNGETVLVTTGSKNRRKYTEFRQVHADDLGVNKGTLTCNGKSEWTQHPLMSTGLTTNRAIRDSWHVQLNLSPEVRNDAGAISRPGLRNPQVGALHALAAHWSIHKNSTSLVVLPTGTGKTEVMLAGLVMSRPDRLLVLVPSDALRTQIANKFTGLGVLFETGALPPTCKRPVVAILLKGSSNEETLRQLSRANVVVSTVAMLQNLPDAELGTFAKLFDTVFFDEAHHVPARSWKRIHDALTKACVVGFTATPFRLDGERLPGKIVYQFPLRLAQEQGYFRPIKFIPIDEVDTDEADREIAQQAIRQLRQDRAAGLNHILMARAATKLRATKLYTEIYSRNAADLNPALIYSGIKGENALARAIREGLHQIIVCVDMFGEGFDLPALKIAAMHDIHQSLAITLQFTGRFTRTDEKYGSATLVANLGEPRVQEAVENLYAEDADWNLLIPELSERANTLQLQLAEFIDSIQSIDRGEGAFDLSTLRPKTSTLIYSCPRFSPLNFRRGLHSKSRVRKIWMSREKDLLIFITSTALPIDWAHVKDVNDDIWDLFILAFDRERRLLFVHSSQTSTTHSALAEAVSGRRAVLLRGEKMFRALSGFSRLVFQNVGLYGRGKLRFRMYTGYDVSDAISPTAQAGGMKSNIFGVGYENGRRGTIGVSTKGRLWSMTSSSIPEWRKWCEGVATKVLDEKIPTDQFLSYTLMPQEISALPSSHVLAVMLPDEWILDAEGVRLSTSNKKISTHSVGVGEWSRISDQILHFSLEVENERILTIALSWGTNSFTASQVEGAPLLVRVKGTDQSIGAHLSENPPVLFFADGSELRGNQLLSHPSRLPLLFDSSLLRVLNWKGAKLNVESKWRHGSLRDDSIQGRLIDELVASENDFVIDDDDSGEAADVVEIAQRNDDVLFRFYHCKYSVGSEPGVRVSDLYEVCGQAIRSARLVGYPDALLAHLETREREPLRQGRPTRFEKGTLSGLRKLRRTIDRYKSRFEIAIVQPGLSKSAITPEAATVLGSADAFIREFTGSPLVVYASD